MDDNYAEVRVLGVVLKIVGILQFAGCTSLGAYWLATEGPTSEIFEGILIILVGLVSCLLFIGASGLLRLALNVSESIFHLHEQQADVRKFLMDIRNDQRTFLSTIPTPPPASPLQPSE